MIPPARCHGILNTQLERLLLLLLLLLLKLQLPLMQAIRDVPV